MGSILVLYHSQEFGNTATMAQAIGEGARAAAAVAIVAMLAIAVLQALLVFGRVRFEQTLRPILILGGILGLWWLATSIVSLVHGALPASLAWIGIAVGVSNVLTAIGFGIGGQEHPLTAVGFVVVAVSVPIWCFRLGRLLASS